MIVFDSADPEFFIAHVDMSLGDTPDAVEKPPADLPAGVNVFQALGELLRHQPQVTIVKLAGMGAVAGRSSSRPDLRRPLRPSGQARRSTPTRPRPWSCGCALPARAPEISR